MLNFLKHYLQATSTITHSASKHGIKNSSNRLFCVHHTFILLAIISLLTLSSCSPIPTSVIEEPSTARARPIEKTSSNAGAIYNANNYRAMFQDRKPRGVGDIITVNIQENTAVTKTGGSSGSKDSSIATSVSSLFGSAVPSATIGADGSSSYTDKADANSSNVFNGTITTTVIEVLANGYFLVSGEKQVSLDKGTEFVRFSGVINPDSITRGNFVSSTVIADARIEYRTASKIDAAEIANAVARFFLSIGI